MSLGQDEAQSQLKLQKLQYEDHSTKLAECAYDFFGVGPLKPTLLWGVSRGACGYSAAATACTAGALEW